MTLVPTFVPAPSGPRFDEPGAAAWQDLERRRPADARLDMPRLYQAATRQVVSQARFSSAINRDLPFAQPASRVWMSGSLIVPLKESSTGAGILDAWTPLGPGNIGGRTRTSHAHVDQHAITFHPQYNGDTNQIALIGLSSSWQWKVDNYHLSCAF